MGPEVHAAVARFRATWDGEVRRSLRRTAIALVFAVLFGVAHLARIGLPLARAIAGGLLAATLLGLLGSTLVARRRNDDARRIIRTTIGRTNPELGAATLRAMTLSDRAKADPIVGSFDLASLHLRRLLGRASIEDVAQRAADIARTWSTI